EDAVVQAGIVREPLAFAGKEDDVGRARFRRKVDALTDAFVDARVILLAIDAVADAGGAGHHGGEQTILLQGGPILRTDQVKPFGAEAGSLFAHLVHGHAAAEDAAADALLQAALARDGLGGGASGRCSEGTGHRRKKRSSGHAPMVTRGPLAGGG